MNLKLNKFYESLPKQNLFIAFIFILLPYLVLRPLFAYETWPGGHDSVGTIFNAWTMIKALRENFHFPLKWQVENYVYNGNPYWGFYQPLSYLAAYVASIFTSLFGKDCTFSALKAAVYISFIISEIGMFLLLREIFKSSPVRNFLSAYGSIIYLLAPYRFIDLYSRNAYSELWTFPWMPFYLLGFYKLFFLKEVKSWFILGLSMACLFLSHLMPSFFFILITHLAFLIYLILQKQLIAYFKQNKKVLLFWVIGNVFGIFLSSFFIFSTMNVIKYLDGDYGGFERVSLPHVLEHISWCFDMLNPSNFHGAWQVGQLYLFGIVVLNFLLFKKQKSEHRDLMLFLNISIMITFIFLMSKTLWEHLPPIFYGLQFSWRLFVVYSVFASVIVTLLVNELKLGIPILLIFLAFHFYTGERFLHYGGGDVVNKYHDTESWLNDIYHKSFTVSCNGGGSPNTLLPKTSFPVLFNFQQTAMVGYLETVSNSYLLNLKPGTQILSSKHSGNSFIYNLLLDKPAFLIFKQHFYPSWELYIDSKRVKDLYLTDFGYNGFEVPRGEHLVQIRTN